jgi:uncharacterized protein (TIGR02118 family)
MHKLLVIYPRPADPDAFCAYYAGTHIPLARKLPGLVRLAYGYPQPLGPGEAPFCVFEAVFADAAALDAALGSAAGRAVAADVPNYSPAGASLMRFDVTEP